jgi:hypothetical protein
MEQLVLYVFFVRRTERTFCEQEHQGKEHSQTHFDCWSRNTSELYSHLLSTLFIFLLMQPQMNVSKQLQGSLHLKPSLICPFLNFFFPIPRTALTSEFESLTKKFLILKWEQ